MTKEKIEERIKILRIMTGMVGKNKKALETKGKKPSAFGEDFSKHVHDVSKNINEHFDKRTSLILKDSTEKIKSSENPLMRLENQKISSHARSSLIYASAAAGLFANAEEVSRFTRALMDHDQAVLQQMLRKVFSPEEAREISLWMDTAPGSEIAGGWAHRVFHGHDLNAMFHLIKEHGGIGAAEWANHVWLRDFWTPHGVPYLPAGSGNVYEWLTDMGVSPSTAMGLLTVNAAEAATGILLFYSGKRATQGLKSAWQAREYRSKLKRIEMLVSEGSEKDAIRLVDEMETFSKSYSIPTIRLDLAILCLGYSHRENGTENASWGRRAFTIAYELCRESPDHPNAIPYHGNTWVSFHGVAATVMSAAFSTYIQKSKTDWEFVSSRLEFGVKRFLELSSKQASPVKLRFKGKPVIGYRPFSALTNQLLALELVIAYGSLQPTSIDPIVIRRRLEELSNQLIKEGGDSGALANNILDNLRRVYPLAS